MKRAAITPLVATALVGMAMVASTDSVYQGGNSFIDQNWSDSTKIVANDDWSGVSGIVGFLGDSTAITTSNIDPRTIVIDQVHSVDVNANRSDPNLFISGGVSEFEGPPGFDRVVALQGSGTADSPYLRLHLNTHGYASVRLTYDLRDIDGSADNSVQQFNAQYRVGQSGVWTNLDSTYVADATTGPSLATLVTSVATTLPPAASDQKFVEVRIMTTNAAGNDEWVGIDNIKVVGVGISDVPAGSTWSFIALASLLMVGGGLLMWRRRSVHV
jgi:hypothetical protein